MYVISLCVAVGRMAWLVIPIVLFAYSIFDCSLQIFLVNLTLFLSQSSVLGFDKGNRRSSYMGWHFNVTAIRLILFVTLVASHGEAFFHSGEVRSSSSSGTDGSFGLHMTSFREASS